MTRPEQWLVKRSTQLDRFVELFIGGRWWLLKSLAFILVLGAIFNSPARTTWQVVGWEKAFLEAKVESPFSNHDSWAYLEPELLTMKQALAPEAYLQKSGSIQGVASHFDKLAYRLTVPLLGKVFGTGALSWPIFGLLGGVLLMLLILCIAHRHFQNRLMAFYLGITFVLAWPGLSMYYSAGSKGDLVAWACLLAAMWFRSPGVIAAFILLAGFTDERAVVASGYVFIYWVASTRHGQDRAAWYRAAAVAIGVLGYLGGRYYLFTIKGLVAGTSMIGDQAILRSLLEHAYPWKFVQVFELAWCWLLFLPLVMFLEKDRLLLALFTGVTMVMIGIVVVVWDTERSLCYLLPCFPLAWLIGGYSANNAMILARLGAIVGAIFSVPWVSCLRYALKVVVPGGL